MWKGTNNNLGTPRPSGNIFYNSYYLFSILVAYSLVPKVL